MSIKFAIRNTAAPAEKEGDQIIRYSGTAEPFNRSDERLADKRGVDGAGKPRFFFRTGLEEKEVQFYHWYNDEEKKAVKAQIKEYKKLIEDYYGGAENISATNQYFWRDTREHYVLTVNNETVDLFYDTTKPEHALLYLSIIANAFNALVAPTKEYAIANQIPHYLQLENETNDFSEEVEITRSDAHGALGYLRSEQPEALYILAWCLQYDTVAYGAYTRQTSPRELINYHIKYIDGKLVTKKKRNMPKTFLEYVEKWKGQQTREAVIVEAYVKAGDYYSFITNKEKKFVTTDGTVLGNRFEEAVENLLKPKFREDFEKLKDQVEAKWAE